jgi:regulator of protease activity HflC (stomatin/prohibitin superfamily)
MADNDWASRLASEKASFESLRGQKSRIEGEATQVERSLEEAKRRAMDLFGTSDPDELEKQANDLDAANAVKADEFINAVAKIRESLKTVMVPSSGARMGQ